MAAALVASGGLMVAASWQRWAAACPWSADWETRACEVRMDHRYDFLPPVEPWAPVGATAQLAGASLLVLAVALLLLPRASTGRTPAPAAGVAVAVTALAVVDVGVATLRSGLEGAAVGPVAGSLSTWLWLLLAPAVLAFLAPLLRGWSGLTAAVLLVLASPLVAAFSYAIGSFDARPWWEAVSGALTVTAGLCLLAGEVRRPSSRPVAVGEGQPTASWVSASRDR